MDAVFREEFTDFSGGNVDGVPPRNLAANECGQTRNFFAYGPELHRRGGTRQLTAEAFTERVTAAFVYKDTDGARVLILATLEGYAKLDAVDVPIPIPSSVPIPALPTPPHFTQYLNFWYSVRGNNLLRGNADLVDEAGIDAPTAAATIAQASGAGGMVAGDYIIVYRYINLETGIHSNYSPVSNTLTLAGNKKINATGIAVSSDPFVTGRQVAITFPSQDGEYFIIDTIEDNTTTTLTIDVTVDDYGDQMVQDAFLPPSNLSLLAAAWERLWVSDGTDLFYSAVGLVECFNPDFDFVSVYPDEVHRIKAMHFWGASKRLVIGKTNRIHYIVKLADGGFRLETMDDEHGCSAPHSMKSAASLIWYDGSSNRFFESTGGAGVPIDDWKIKSYLDRIPVGLRDQVYATIFPELDWYVVSIPVSVVNDDKRVVLVYNYRTKAWFPFDWEDNFGPHFVVVVPEEDGNRSIYAAFNQPHIYRINDPTRAVDIDDAQYSSVVRPRSIVGRAVGNEVTCKRVIIGLKSKIATHLGEAKLRFYGDGELINAESLNIDIYRTPKLMPFDFGPISDAFTEFAVEFLYRGEDADELVLTAMVVEGIEISRTSVGVSVGAQQAP